MTRVLCVIPAHNEAASLAAVVEDLRSCALPIDLLVVDDGSMDGTDLVLDRLGVRWLRLPERMGIGCAMRVGLRYAVRLGYDAAVRVDGDGQHEAGDLEALLAPIRDGLADVTIGTRYAHRATGCGRPPPPAQRLLAAVLRLLGATPVTDPTSGLCAVGRRALRVLAEHHPTGYPEPELRLFLSRNDFRVVEVPVRNRPRTLGHTSLTAGRVTVAGARVALAMIVVPLRGRVG